MISKLIPVGLVAFLVSAPDASGLEIDIPLQVDYQHIQRSLIKQIYTDTGTTADIWKDGTGCSSIVFSNPRVGSRRGLIHLVNNAKVRLGAVAGDGCVSMLEWNGTIETFHKPRLEPGAPVVKFPVVDANALQSDGTRFTSGPVWELVKRYTKPRLGPMRVDLQPAVNQLRKFLPLVVEEEGSENIKAMLDSLAFEMVNANDDYLALKICFEVEKAVTAYQAEPPFTKTEAERWERVWQQWDAFVTYAVKYIAADTDSEKLREVLLDILLEARYDVRSALVESSGKQHDPVRALFVKTWSRLAPVLREVSNKSPDDLPLNYLTFIAAGDALRALDKVGPTVGMEISTDGLRRLARILAPEDRHDPLEYNQEIDPSLRKLFGFQPAKPVLSPRPSANNRFSLFRVAHADPAVSETALVKRLHRWVPGRGELTEYLRLVHMLLVQTAYESLKTGKLESQYTSLYRIIVLATAWQESCWRQFIVEANKIRVLKSTTGDVGLMQVNSGVWRGFYDVNRLSDEINYNAWAGGEILMHYLVDYALKKKSIVRPATRTTWLGQPMRSITVVHST